VWPGCLPALVAALRLACLQAGLAHPSTVSRVTAHRDDATRQEKPGPARIGRRAIAAISTRLVNPGLFLLRADCHLLNDAAAYFAICFRTISSQKNGFFY
jgi:hypothetical protein